MGRTAVITPALIRMVELPDIRSAGAVFSIAASGQIHRISVLFLDWKVEPLGLHNLIVGLVGKPFLLGGRGSAGYDCYGLVREVQRFRGIELPDSPTPESMQMRAAMVEKITGGWTDLLDKTEPYCVVLFYGPHMGWHVGVVLEDCRRFIHVAHSTRTARIDRLDEWPWDTRIYGFFRMHTNYDSGPAGA